MAHAYLRMEILQREIQPIDLLWWWSRKYCISPSSFSHLENLLQPSIYGSVEGPPSITPQRGELAGFRSFDTNSYCLLSPPASSSIHRRADQHLHRPWRRIHDRRSAPYQCEKKSVCAGGVYRQKGEHEAILWIGDHGVYLVKMDGNRKLNTFWSWLSEMLSKLTSRCF